MYALFERIEGQHIPGKKRLLITRFQVPQDVSANKTSIRRPLPAVHSIDESKSETEESFINNNNQSQVNRENIHFIYLDLNFPLNRDLIGPLRTINDDVQIYSKSATCLDLLHYSNDSIFFISSSNDRELIKEAHDCIAVEAIFILNSDAKIDKNRFPKIFGVYRHSEELVVALKSALELFEQTQIEFFTFEGDQTFLWLQLWREEFLKPTNSQVPSNKEKLVNMTEKYYRGNTKLLEFLDDFDYCYERSEALQWCFSSPFPSRFLHHALKSRNTQHIDLCRFLITDIYRVLQQPNNLKASRQFYRGIKLTSEDLDRLMKHTGKLICPKGFFICNKSRKVALDLARSQDYRPDLRPVLFKVNCPPSVSIGEMPINSTSGLIIFDVYTAFRVKCVNRGPVSIAKIEPADEDGRNLARGYRMKYNSENVQSLLNQLSVLPKPPARLPPVHRPPPPPPASMPSKKSPKKVSSSTLSKEEIRAQNLARDGKVDEALTVYQRLKSHSPRVLNIMGQLYADRKGDYNSAVTYYEQAIKIQEENGDDATETLTQLGIAHHNRREFDLALACHNRALSLQKDNNQINQSSVASSLIGIANAQYGQENLSEAFQNAQQALALNESIESENDLNLGMNLAVIANIHHKAGDDVQALDFAQRALTILEGCVPSDSLTLASILNNMGAIQMAVGLFSDAQHSFDRALKICEKTLPEGHPKRVTMEKNIQLIIEIINTHTENAKVQS